MAEIDTVRSRLAELKRQGKTESTSKEAGKLSKRLSELKSGGATGTKIGSELGTDLSSALAQAREAIIGQGNVLGQQQTLATSRELGRRGILPNTGLGEQEIATAQRPITAATQSALGNLGVQGANLFEQQRQFDLQNQLAQQAQALQQRQFEQVTLPYTLAQISNIGKLSPLEQMQLEIARRYLESDTGNNGNNGIPSLEDEFNAFKPAGGGGGGSF